MAWIITVRPYLELVSFLATTVLAVGLLLSRQQLLSFRKDVEIRNQRQAREKAVEAAMCYMQDYISKNSTYYQKCKELKVESYKGVVGNFTPKSLNISEFENGVKRAFLDETLPMLNILESVAAYFVSGVADEKTGFQIIGKSFCSTVKTNYDVISLLRESDAINNYWFNIIELYKVWSSRVDRMNLIKASEDIQKNLREIPNVAIATVGYNS